MANTFKLIKTVTVPAGGAASIVLDNIPQTYTDLVIKASARTNRSGYTWDELRATFNNTGFGYSNQIMYGQGTGAVSGVASQGATAMTWFIVNASNMTTGIFGSFDIHIANYSRESFQKTVNCMTIMEASSATACWQYVYGASSSVSAPITSIEFTSGFGANFLENSSISIYGISKS